MKKLVLFFVLLFAIQLFSAPVDSTKYQHDPNLTFWLWKYIRGYIIYGDTTYYNKRFESPQVTGNVWLENNERIGNETDGTIFVLFNDDSSILGTLKVYSNVDSPNVADNDRFVLQFAAEDDSSDQTVFVQIEPKFLDVTDGTEDGSLTFKTLSGGTLTTSLALYGTSGLFPTINYVADTSVVNDTYGITLNPAPTAYFAGMEITFKAGVANTGACTINVNALGAKSLKSLHDQDPADNYIEVGSIVKLIYDGTNFQIISPDANP